MTRLALESLGIKSGLTAVAASDTTETLPVTPGVWRLATWLSLHSFLTRASHREGSTCSETKP